MSKLDIQLEQLRTTLMGKQLGYEAKVEHCLAEISQINDPDSIQRLLLLLDDSAPDELMFSIVHEVEKWDDLTYSKVLLDSVQCLWEKSPRWAQILHIRVLNAKCTADVYFDILNASPMEKQVTVRNILEAIGKGWPKLTAKILPILERMKSL